MSQGIIGSIEWVQCLVRDRMIGVGHRLQPGEKTVSGEFGFRGIDISLDSSTPFVWELLDVFEKRERFRG